MSTVTLLMFILMLDLTDYVRAYILACLLILWPRWSNHTGKHYVNGGSGCGAIGGIVDPLFRDGIPTATCALNLQHFTKSCDNFYCNKFGKIYVIADLA